MNGRKFSIILPVRNGMPYIMDSVGSVLSQTYKNFELHILDNKSSDGTLAWCESIDDPRVKVSTSGTSLSIEDSWGRITGIDKCEFITMFAHDDVLLPDFLENIDGLISEHPGAKLYQTNGELIDKEGFLVRRCRPISEIETSDDYLQARFSGNRDVFGTGYVMRAKAYDSLGGIPKFNKLSFADDALWLMLIDDGYKACCSSNSIQVRIHENSTSATSPDNWLGFLVAIKQFAEFLDDHHQQKRSAMTNTADLKKNFFKRYLINIYILSLVHHAEQRIDFSTGDLNLFKDTYKTLVGSTYVSMILTPKLLPIALIYKVCRPLLPLAWRVYQSYRAS